jgi:NADPH:quinone reductase-like Zn-dependent oxidoreductase
LDAVLALTGGETLERIVNALKAGGLLGYPNGVDPKPLKRSGIRVLPYDAVAGVREFSQLAMAVEAANLKVPIAAKFPLGEASLAHKRMAQGHVLGKMVLEIS